ncbi:ArsR/SmtB family transcription factor [Longispora albida]|uniref:ArsR/SmtB family transcription factor n=1 Tax=Longispora albida TaxID=203523 RepID=UPI00037B1EA9|nr:winged helix-turn-helix domain-containing protein [Longispora albida]
MLRILFTVADLAAVSVAPEPDPAIEAHYARRLLAEPGPTPLDAWRRRLRSGRYEKKDFWPQIQARVAADRGTRTRALLDGGVAQLLRTLHPMVRWTSPELCVPSPGGVYREIQLTGGGLLLQPSVFCWRQPELSGDGTLVYPASAEPASEAAGLSGLIGRTRAVILGILAAGGASTTELARQTGMSAASASQHAGILRAAGAISTRRAGQSVLHTLTPLGEAMVNSADRR